jgi:hypothetical protein
MTTTLNLSDPIVLKGGAGLALWAFGGSKLTRWAGIALAGWAAWDYLKVPGQTALVSVPLNPQAIREANGGSLFPSWPTSYTPSIRPARPGEPGYLPPPGEAGAPLSAQGLARMRGNGEVGAKILPLRMPTAEERAAFYGIDEDD